MKDAMLLKRLAAKPRGSTRTAALPCTTLPLLHTAYPLNRPSHLCTEASASGDANGAF